MWNHVELFQCIDLVQSEHKNVSCSHHDTTEKLLNELVQFYCNKVDQVFSSPVPKVHIIRFTYMERCTPMLCCLQLTACRFSPDAFVTSTYKTCHQFITEKLLLISHNPLLVLANLGIRIFVG